MNTEEEFTDMLMPTGGILDSKSETIPDRVVHGSNPDRTATLPDNTITNTKYTWYTFLPKNIFEQFSLNFNRYFLFIALLQLEPSITPVNPASTWGPLLLIFGLSAAKSLLDDLRRRKEDNKANNATYTVVVDGFEQQIPSKDIRVGQVVKLHENEAVPCDLVLLYTSNESGVCYVQTTNLDGESDLKPRRAHEQTHSLGVDGARGFVGVVECPPPNPDLYDFNARMWTTPADGVDAQTVPRSQPFSISGDSLLQQGIAVRNTEYVYGVTTYTGNQTKFGNNKSDPPLKLTKSELFMDKVTIVVFIFQLTLVCILGVVGEGNRTENGVNMWYLGLDGNDPWYEWIIIPARFLLLNSTMIPISLKVTLDICKLYYARFIHGDVLLYDATTNEDTVANNTSISEDLGQTEYILTDKTGTLTQNVMVFKQCSIGERLYSVDECRSGETFITAIADRSNADVVEYFKNFALNNSVVPTIEGGAVVYKGASPDEIALVKTAAQYGIVLTKREGTRVCIEVAGVPEEYKLVQELGFTSFRKRMSVVLESEATKEMVMYTKGADEVLMSRLDGKYNECVDDTVHNLETFARQGLRTLMYCKKNITRAEYNSWATSYEDATMCLGEERKAKVSAVYDALETQFCVQGASGIEDDLQDLVPETIALLRRADIKFWMLTGDKFSTALEIAKSCKLMSSDPDKTCLVHIHGNDVDEIGDSIYDASRTLPTRSIRVFESDIVEGDGKEYVVIIEGPDLKRALAENRKDLRKVCLRADTVICCRVSPKQKAELVQMVRSAGKQTLAIGDGGNDVGMIQGAHIGVGIRGKEGLQAARASDYVVPWFKALTRLTLVHGRSSYVRTSLIAQYSFYKSFMFCVMQIAFNTLTDVSGTTMFNTASVTAYNAVLFFPIVSFVTWRDLPFNMVLRNPKVYMKGIAGAHFRWGTVVLWFARGLWQGIVLFLIVVLSRGVSYHRKGDGFESDYETLGFAGFLTYLWIQALTMMLEVTSLTLRTFGFIWGLHFITIFGLFVTAKMIAFHGLNEYGAFPMALSDPQLWLISILGIAVCILPVVAWKYVSFMYYTTDIDYLRVKAVLGLTKSVGKDNPFALEEEQHSGLISGVPSNAFGGQNSSSGKDSKESFIPLDDFE